MKSSIRSTSELARLLGVSRWTVSRALNNQPGVSAATVALVRATAQQRGFAPSLLGRGLRTGSTDLIGVCLPDLEEFFLTSKITLLRNALEAKGWRPTLQIIDGTAQAENESMAHFASLRCAGVISFASCLRDEDPGLRSLGDAHIPVVRIDPLQSAATPSVHTDRKAAMQIAIKHLHALGHRQVMAAGFSPSGTYARQRLAGLRQGARAVGWDPDRDLLLLPHPGMTEDFSAGATLAKACLGKIPRCPAILAINDRVALGLLRVLQARGLSIPEDVTLVGYDNSALAPFAGPGLTSVDPQAGELIAHAVQLLTPTRIEKRKKIQVTPRIVIRASSAAPPKSSE